MFISFILSDFLYSSIFYASALFFLDDLKWVCCWLLDVVLILSFVCKFYFVWVEIEANFWVSDSVLPSLIFPCLFLRSIFNPFVVLLLTDFVYLCSILGTTTWSMAFTKSFHAVYDLSARISMAVLKKLSHDFFSAIFLVGLEPFDFPFYWILFLFMVIFFIGS